MEMEVMLMPGIETSPTYGEINFIPYVPTGYAGGNCYLLGSHEHEVQVKKGGVI